MPATTSSLRGIHLVALEPQHSAELFRWASDEQSGFRWRFGGSTPSPAQFADALWAGVLCQYLAVDGSGQLVGLAVCYAADHQNGHAYFAVQGNPARPTGAGAMVGLLQLVDHVFTHWPFRKLYADIPGYNEAEFAGALRRHLRTEGRLKDHLFYNDRYWDMVTCALTREDWFSAVRPRFVVALNDLTVSERIAS